MGTKTQFCACLGVLSMVTFLILPSSTFGSIWDLKKVGVGQPSLSNATTTGHGGYAKLRTGRAESVQLSREFLSPCAALNISLDCYVVVSPDIVHGLGAHAKDRVDPCVSNMTVTNVETGKSIIAYIVPACGNCANNFIYLSPPAFDQLAVRENGEAFINIYYNIDKILTSENANNTHLEPWEQPPSNISANTLDVELKTALVESIKKNSIQINQSCDQETELQRKRTMDSDVSHLFQNDLNLTSSLELRYRLMKSNHLKGNFCNSYENLICHDTSTTCQCSLREDVFPEAMKCATSIFGPDWDNLQDAAIQGIGPTCIMDVNNVIYHEYGIAVPYPRYECWFFGFCTTVKDGRLCNDENVKWRAKLGLKDHNHDSVVYQLRFPLNGTDTSTSDCVCMTDLNLKVIVTTISALLQELIKFKEVNTLELHSACNLQMEELKVRNIRQLRALDGQPNPTLFKYGLHTNMVGEYDQRSQVWEVLSLINNSSDKLCQLSKHLMCDEETQRCVCYSNPDEHLEFVQHDDECVLREDSICDPAFWSVRFENYVGPYQDDAKRPSCERNLPCVDMSTGRLCLRNDSNYVSFEFRDKIFPYLDPRFKDAETQFNADLGLSDYCRCGEPFVLGAMTRPWWMWTLLSLFGLIVVVISPIAVWYYRKLRVAKNFLKKLPTNEQRVFLEGDRELFGKYIEDEGIRAQFRAYDKKRHEIPKTCVRYGEQIGEGGFGVVLKGSVTRGGVTKTVAIKKCGEENNVDSIRAFLAELKILQFIGRHENVIQFVGAITENMPAPQLVLEYCQRGSLDHVVRSNQSMFLNQIKDDQVHFTFAGVPGDEDTLWTISTHNLLRWSLQIAAGMKYLSAIRVVHGDLFLKNVLVGGDGLAKITDFGLSCRFAHDHKNYIRIQEGFLPRAHLLPPEVRRDNTKMSLKMDVWTFGILLWELFTLGHEPKSISSAEELPKPEYATSVHYAIMQSCWAPKQTDRPDFGKLMKRLRSALGPSAANVNARFDFNVNFIPKRLTEA